MLNFSMDYQLGYCQFLIGAGLHEAAHAYTALYLEITQTKKLGRS